MTDPLQDPQTPLSPEATTTTPPVSPTTAKPSQEASLTPLYAAAGLAEVVMTSLRSRLSQAQVKALPATSKTVLADLQQQFRTYRDQVTQSYSSLATKGKPTVDSTLVTVRHLSGRAERKVDDLRDAAAPTPTTESTPADQVPPVVVQPVVVVDTDADRTPGGAG